LSQQVAVANAAGCSFCQDGSVTNSVDKISLSDENVMHTCKDWQQDPTLTAGFNDAACKFIAPFYEATCDCTVTSKTHDECHLCGMETLEFADPAKGLVIPSSNKQEILCRTIFDGVKAGAVPSTDCQVLRGITDYCGGCVQIQPDPFDTFTPRNDFSEEKIATFPGNVNPTPQPTLGNVNPTPQPTLATFVGEIAKFPEVAEAQIAEAATMPPSASPSDSPSASPSTLSPTASPSASPTVANSGSPTTSHSGEPTSSPTTGQSESPTIANSSAPTSSPTTGPSASPTVANSLQLRIRRNQARHQHRVQPQVPLLLIPRVRLSLTLLTQHRHQPLALRELPLLLIPQIRLSPTRLDQRLRRQLALRELPPLTPLLAQLFHHPPLPRQVLQKPRLPCQLPRHPWLLRHP